MMQQWRDIQVGTWFTVSGHERINAEVKLVRIVYAITGISEGYVSFHATHDHTDTYRKTLGWVIDHGHEIF